jgi:hypothetical protein
MKDRQDSSVVSVGRSKKKIYRTEVVKVKVIVLTKIAIMFVQIDKDYFNLLKCLLSTFVKVLT